MSNTSQNPLLPAFRDLYVTFWERVIKIPGGCWEWGGHVSRGGYGSLYWKGTHAKAHRVAWEITNGYIPVGEGHHGICVCHKCDNRKCVNPEHLFLGTHQDNMKDRDRKGRLRYAAAIAKAAAASAARKRSRTHCRNGHMYTKENTYHWPKKPEGRRCLDCKRTRWARGRPKALE